MPREESIVVAGTAVVTLEAALADEAEAGKKSRGGTTRLLALRAAELGLTFVAATVDVPSAALLQGPRMCLSGPQP
jgi:hypothetical protein